MTAASTQWYEGVSHAVPWLEAETAQVTQQIVDTLARERAEVQAILLFGSVARHEERAVDEFDTSHVDLLVIVRPARGRHASRSMTRLPCTISSDRRSMSTEPRRVRFS